VTTWVPDDVIVSWTAPDNGGSPITGYIVTIRKSDQLTFSEELTNCDMSASTAVTCTIPALTLREAPFNLLWGAQIIARVTAINAYGNSVESEQVNGATIITAPDAPIDLTEDSASRSASAVTLTWSKA